MLAIGTGVFFGRLKMGKITFGVSCSNVYWINLGGIFGYRMNEEIFDFIRDFGLILFVYGIGLQVGPSFFSSFRNEGLSLTSLLFLQFYSADFIYFLLFKFTGLSIENLVGIMSGGL
jgi:putative transport protein